MLLLDNYIWKHRFGLLWTTPLNWYLANSHKHNETVYEYCNKVGVLNVV